MKLIPEWKQVATGAWSFIFSIVNAIFLAAAAGWEQLAPEDLHLSTTTYLSIASILFAITGGSRLVQQQKLAEAIASYLKDNAGAIGKKTTAAVMAAVISTGVVFTAGWEGKENKAYWDSYGKVWTVCYGETKGVKKGDYYTDAQCKAMLEREWADYYAQMRKYFPKLITAPISVQAAAVDLGYNNGVMAVVNSKNTGGALRSGDWERFCNMLPSWNKSNGKFVRGLWNRRKDSQKLCLSGLR